MRYCGTTFSLLSVVFNSILQTINWNSFFNHPIQKSFNILSEMFTVLSNKFKKCLFKWKFTKTFLWSGNLWLCSSVTEFYCFSKFPSFTEMLFIFAIKTDTSSHKSSLKKSLNSHRKFVESSNLACLCLM